MKHHMSRNTKIATSVFVTFVIGLGVLLWYTYRLGDMFISSDDGEHLSTAAVVTNVEECTNIAYSILKMDGSAADAAIAVTFCYGVTQPHASGIGGGFLATIYIKKRKKIETLNAREVAPLKISEDLYKENTTSSYEGGLAIAVPTEVKGLWELHQKYGKLSWKTLIKPSIDLAEKGFTVPSYLAKVLIAREEKIRNIKLFRDLYINPATNTIYHEGETMKNPKLSETLKIISEEGVDAIYSEKGSLGHKLVEEIQANGGVMIMDDLRIYNPKWGSSVSTKLFNGDTLHTTPIPSSGCLIPFILNILDGYKLYENSLKYHDENKLIYHRIVETFKFAFGERTKLGDVLNADVVEAVRELQNVDYANRIITFINDEHTFNDTSYYGAKGSVDADYGTAHVSVLASNGDAISLTTTINDIFGSWIMSESTGIVYNDEMDDFSIPSASDGLLMSKANSVQPSKSPMSSMSPIIVLNQNHEVTLTAGGTGGILIVTSLVLFLVNFLHLNQTMEAALASKRFHHQLEPMHVRLEDGYDRPDIVSFLNEKGHQTKISSPVVSAFASIVAISNRNGKVETAIDPRRGGKGVKINLEYLISTNLLLAIYGIKITLSCSC